jgi:hypothetical protein
MMNVSLNILRKIFRPYYNMHDSSWYNLYRERGNNIFQTF